MVYVENDHQKVPQNTKKCVSACCGALPGLVMHSIVWAELALRDAEGALLELLRPLDGLEAVFATLRWSGLYAAMLGLVPP